MRAWLRSGEHSLRFARDDERGQRRERDEDDPTQGDEGKTAFGETVAGIGNSLEEIPAGSTGQRETERGQEKMPPAGLPSSSETRGQNGGGRTEDGQ